MAAGSDSGPEGHGDRRDDADATEVLRFPGFRDMAQRRRRLIADLVERRKAAGLSQTDVAARMGTSQSSVARLEAGAADARLSTLQRYAGAVGQEIEWQLRMSGRGSRQP